MAELTDNEEEYEDYVSPDYGFNPLTTLLWCYCQALALAAIPDSGEGMSEPFMVASESDHANFAKHG